MAISILTLLACIGYAWNRDQRTAALEGQVRQLSLTRDVAMRCQERLDATLLRVDKLERFDELQAVYNTTTLSDLKLLKAKAGE